MNIELEYTFNALGLAWVQSRNGLSILIHKYHSLGLVSRFFVIILINGLIDYLVMILLG